MRPLRLLVGAAFVAVLVAAAGVAPAGATATPSFQATDVTTCSGSSTVTVRIDAQNPPPVQQAADIVLVVDASGSIGLPTFDSQVRPSLQSFITSTSPSAGGNHVGIVEFSTGATDVTTGLLFNGSALQTAVLNMPYTGGYTYTHDALDAAESMLAGSGARPGVPKVIIVETDGVWLGPNPTITAQQDPTSLAASLVSSGTAIFAVGVGNGVNPADLTAIAGGDPTHVFSITDYTGLTTALDQALLEAVPAATNLTYAVTPTSDWTITGATASAGTATVSSGGLSWSLGSINSATPASVTITYTEQHVGSTDGSAVPLASTATLGYTDATGAAQSVDYSGQTVAVSGCNEPPVANAGSDQSVALNGSHTANVTLDGTGSSDPNNDPLTYTWSESGTTIATGATPTVPLGIGSHTLTLSVFDGEFTSTDDVTIDVYDPTPPVVTASVTGTEHNGWYTSDAVVSFTVTDAESAVTTQSPDCAGATVATDTAGMTFACTATSAGGTSTPVSVTVKRDATSPSIVFGGNAGTYGVADTVAITCTAADATSGLASSPDCGGVAGPAWSFGAGTHTFSRSATDNAGNVGTASVTFTVAVDAAGLCALAEQWSDSAGVANSLCAKLDHGQLAALQNELAAQRGKHIPADKADILLALSQSL